MTAIDFARGATYTPAASPSTRMTPYQVTQQAYGPTAASAAVLTAAVTDGADAVCSFSSEGLQQAYAAVQGFADRVGAGAGAAADAVEDAYDSVAQTLGDAAEAFGDGVAAAVDTAASYAALGVAALG